MKLPNEFEGLFQNSKIIQVVFLDDGNATRSSKTPTIGVKSRLTNNIPQNPNLEFLPIMAMIKLQITIKIIGYIRNSAS